MHRVKELPFKKYLNIFLLSALLRVLYINKYYDHVIMKNEFIEYFKKIFNVELLSKITNLNNNNNIYPPT